MTIFNRLWNDKLFNGLVLAALLTAFLWNVIPNLDFPEYDETYYLRRALAVLDGNIIDANLGNLRNSPVMVLYYALWYRIVGSTEVYNWVFASGIWLMAFAAYGLFGRVLHPFLSMLLAFSAAVASTPYMPHNMRFAVGTGLLWLSLYYFGGGIRARAVGAVVLMLAIFVRPEYLSVLVVLVPALLVYEWRQTRRPRQPLLYTLLVYSPSIIILAFTLIRLIQLSGYEEPRIARTIPFSYAVYIGGFDPERIDLTRTISDQTVFAEDFGTPETYSFTNVLIAFMGNPGKAIPYLLYNVSRFYGAFNTAFFSAWSWSPAVNIREALPTTFSTVAFTAAALGIGIAAWRVRRTVWDFALTSGALRRPTPPLVYGILSLVTLIPWMLLANADQRAFMVLPLVMLPFGMAITLIVLWVAQRANIRKFGGVGAVAAILIVFIIMPRPFATLITSHIRTTLGFIRQHVPPLSVMVGTPVESYANSLFADKFALLPVEASNFAAPTLVNAYRANPEVRYVLLTYVYSESVYTAWFREWNESYPDMPLELVADMPQFSLALYRIPNRVSPMF
jgi:hypothetical protein